MLRRPQAHPTGRAMSKSLTVDDWENIKETSLERVLMSESTVIRGLRTMAKTGKQKSKDKTRAKIVAQKTGRVSRSKSK